MSKIWFQTKKESSAMAHTDDYFAERYGLTLPHSELREMGSQLTGGHALDVGCGRGRNSLFLADHGFTVDALDINQRNIEFLQQIADTENMPGIHAEVRDFNQQPSFQGANAIYDLVVSTVVMMFLQPTTIATLISNMQKATQPGGRNLIVSAMTTDDMPCPVDFPFVFQHNELLDLYTGWQIHKYNENVGELHRTNADGQRIRLRFATLWAQKKP